MMMMMMMKRIMRMVRRSSQTRWHGCKQRTLAFGSLQHLCKPSPGQRRTHCGECHRRMCHLLSPFSEMSIFANLSFIQFFKTASGDSSHNCKIFWRQEQVVVKEWSSCKANVCFDNLHFQSNITCLWLWGTPWTGPAWRWGPCCSQGDRSHSQGGRRELRPTGRSGWPACKMVDWVRLRWIWGTQSEMVDCVGDCWHLVGWTGWVEANSRSVSTSIGSCGGKQDDWYLDLSSQIYLCNQFHQSPECWSLPHVKAGLGSQLETNLMSRYGCMILSSKGENLICLSFLGSGEWKLKD